ncbi:hypothetical protein OESDEN_21767 [Oesophagostomum dentatum]|uniref:Uncharacterized protein n=1 Tax=Oesophagostomum dentatum TaxID=61180 RepID=A0A0B1S5Z2_OESDE|nr:hypothetical protein OESDEN_21767 [Oesophagostomum dentatum]
MAEHGMRYGLLSPPYYDTDLRAMEDEEYARTFCSAYLDQLYKDHDSEAKLKSQFLTGNREEDLCRLMAEGRRYLGLPHLFWGLWNMICAQVIARLMVSRKITVSEGLELVVLSGKDIANL